MSQIVLNVRGKVQGVFFRTHAKEAAGRLGITGFARNERDGSVTVTGEGEEDDLTNFIQLIKNGFGDTFVESIDESWNRAGNDFDSFEIR